ncbi:ABC transporter ATP-binding protein [Mucisphaera calidilacus]|uniref:sn-glycerol-3-phosphate import ATP-binding protein UgpC n=1 Tax=Mucisphaera calidilacus TaxID=2527982 RepID=A0A518BTJ0_9BACT|nr:sn-glycerol-3-phosphate ABC transporter ATP-binding protein UgpC [Mucisphaera calidilacus]QDU70279.1 sn-glycerol-3-phosphate import ATP-binding protein UgpC [Mucisphaera calidilacus]
MAEVVLTQIEKVYPGGFKAVKGIDLHINDAEFIVLVGPSGCGKSTTLRMVAGLEEITGGTIAIGDRVVNDVPPKDRDIAMVFQNYALYPHMSVYKNMAFGLKLRKFPKAEIDRRVQEAARILGIEHLLERKPKALSGGQRQRVAVGRAIVRDPACFLFDEPLSNLDAKLRVETRAELKRLHKRLNTTTIYVTHDQEEAMTLGDRVVVMSEGLIQQCDTPLEVYNHPVNRFVAGFLGTPPMNFLSGKLVEENGQVCFEGEGQKFPLNPDQADRCRARLGSEVTLGLRPEGMFLKPHESASNEDQTGPFKVDVIEPLGNTMDVYLSTSTGARLTARVAAEELDEGTDVKCYFNLQKAHVFEPGDYGLNLTLPVAAAAV